MAAQAQGVDQVGVADQDEGKGGLFREVEPEQHGECLLDLVARSQIRPDAAHREHRRRHAERGDNPRQAERAIVLQLG